MEIENNDFPAQICQIELEFAHDRTPGAIVQVKLDPQSFLSSGKGFLFMENYGRGKLVLFTEDPNFRASYDSLNKPFLNAILLGPSLR